MVFSRISAKASAVTGAVIGFLVWLFVMPYGTMGVGYSAYGMMGYMMGYAYPSFGFLTAVFGAIVGAVFGAILAVVYNWALKIK